MNNRAADFGLPDIDPADALVRRLVGFQAFLREQGFLAGIPEAQDALRLAGAIGITDRRRLRAGLQSLLCSGYGEWQRFGELFDTYFMPPNRVALRESRGGGSNSVDLQQQGDERRPGLIDSLRVECPWVLTQPRP